jgi:hypothetical protein
MPTRLTTIYLVTMLLMLLVAISSPAVRADDTALSRATLKGITTVFVVVESLDDDARKIGLTEEAIQTDVELKLRLAGMGVATNGVAVPGDTYLYVNVGVLPPVAASIQVALEQNVLLQRNGELAFGATTWTLHGEITNPTPQRIRDFTRDLVDRFLNAWLSVNPKK